MAGATPLRPCATRNDVSVSTEDSNEKRKDTVNYDLRKPCSNCSFLRKGGIRLHPARVDEIAGMMIAGGRGEFPCHKTTKDNDEGDLCETPKSKHCAGALIFAEKHDRPTQMMRICERFGDYDRTKLEGFELVFDSIEEMRRTALRRK